ncbi:hypothetical protein [Gemmata sp.]|uniref:hypothetical protein n=1 Tax=Gemmata sp. TaxID=1914242 RepID=UPI003F70CC6D
MPNPISSLEQSIGPNEDHDVLGSWCVTAGGGASLCCYGEDLILSSRGKGTNLFLDATGTASIYTGCAQFVMEASDTAGQVNVTSGAEGTISFLSGLPDLGSLTTLEATATTIQVGVPDVGPVIKLTMDSITLQVGPPGVGASIVMNATSITLKVGEVSLSLGLAGINESVLDVVTRAAAVTGHTLKAAETSAEVGVAGITTSAPISSDTAEASAAFSAALSNDSADAMKTIKGGIVMIQ